MPQWVNESWIALILGFVFIGILLDIVVASREAIVGLINRIRKRQPDEKKRMKDR